VEIDDPRRVKIISLCRQIISMMERLPVRLDSRTEDLTNQLIEVIKDGQETKSPKTKA
tara:strand:+ start:222 stop:395 length:174 start_codon:yes stop_codon:yes gene_type:complete